MTNSGDNAVFVGNNMVARARYDDEVIGGRINSYRKDFMSSLDGVSIEGIYSYEVRIKNRSIQISLCVPCNGHSTRYVKCMLRMHREYRERFPHHRLQRKPLVSDPGMHHGLWATHLPWCITGSLTHGGGENTTGNPGACAARNFTYLAKGQLWLPRKPIITTAIIVHSENE